MPGAFIGFRALFVPRIQSKATQERERQEALWEQRVFFETLQFDLLQRHEGISAEIRYIVNETTREIELHLLVDVRQVNRDARDQLAHDISRVLPRGYGWEGPVLLDELPTPSLTGSTRWCTGRAVRRLVLADIPNPTEPDSSELLPSGTGLGQQDAPRRTIVGFLDSIEQVPADGSWAFPLVMAIQSSGHAAGPAFYEQLQAAAPAVLSIRFARLPPSRLPVLRAVANHYLKLNLAKLSAGIEGAYGQQSASFERYLLPDDLFDVLDISFASPNRQTTEALFHLFTARVGSMSGFALADLCDRRDLRNFGIEHPMYSFLDDFLEERCLYLEDDLTSFHAELPENEPAIKQFLIDIPYVFTLHELLAVGSLPLADERGLPGIDTRPMPPFNAPSLNYDPVVNIEGFPVAANSISNKKANLRIGVRGKVRFTEAGGLSFGAGPMANRADWHRIKSSDLTKHALIAGATGSGKTMVTLFIIRELVRTGKTFAIVEPSKTEYFDRLSKAGIKVQRFGFDGGDHGRPGENFFAFDPLRPPQGTTVARHVSYLKSAWAAAFPMDTLGMLALEGGLIGYYREICGLTMFSRGDPSFRVYKTLTNGKTGIAPGFHTFREYFLSSYVPMLFKEVGNSGRSNDSVVHAVSYFERRFRLIDDGLLGESIREAFRRTAEAIKAENPTPMVDDLDRLFDANSVLELDAIADNDDKCLIMAFALTRLFERRQAEAQSRLPTSAHDLEHVLIIEEAHRLLSASSAATSRGEHGGIDPKAKALTLFVDMLAEIRSLGQGIIIVEQIPTKIIPEAIKNSNLKIMLRLPSHQDRQVLGQAMNLSEEQMQFVATLRANPGSGIDFVVYEEGLDQPILLNLPLPTVESWKEGWLFDEFFQ